MIPRHDVLSAGRKLEEMKDVRMPTTFVQERNKKTRMVGYNIVGNGMTAVVTAAARLANAKV